MTRDPRAALREAIAALRAAGVDDPVGDARRLLEHAAGIAPGLLSSHMPDRIGPGALGRFDGLVALRATRVPVAQLTGTRAFYGRSFTVTADTLDPRPDTEALIDRALATGFSRVLDLGTGTGCILITLLAERPGARGIGTDLSPAAADVARANAGRLGVDDRTEIRQSDWFSGVTGQFDLIVSNPPYIALDEMAGLAPEVRDHEPQMALTDGADGLTAYRAITAGAGAHLTPGGWLMVEIGWQQGVAVAELFRAAGLVDVQVHPDIAGRDRVVSGRKPGDNQGRNPADLHDLRAD